MTTYYPPMRTPPHHHALRAAAQKRVRFDLPDRIPTPIVTPAPRPANPTSQMTINSLLSQRIGSPNQRSPYGPPGSTILDFASPTTGPYPLTYSPVPWNGSSKPTCTPLLAAELSQPATSPPVAQLRIVCRLIPQWPIVVRSANRSAVTCADVINAIWTALHEQVRESEWAALKQTASRATVDAVGKVFRARCRRHIGAEANETSKGLKRVDFFVGFTMFDGLVPGPDTMTWELKVKASSTQ